MSRRTLTPRPLDDAANARHRLQSLAAGPVTDGLVEELWRATEPAARLSADPDQAVRSLVRWAGAVHTPYPHLRFLIDHPPALKLFCLVTGASGYVADLLVRHPGLIEMVTNPGMRDRLVTGDQMRADLLRLIGGIHGAAMQGEALRSWKAQETVRIAVRDLAGLDPLQTAVSGYSAVADASIEAALMMAAGVCGVDSARPLVAAVALGKLGGSELNYCSDIDLLFIADELADERVATEVAERTIQILSDTTASGIVFRVDTRLRPEGNFGALIRSPSSYNAYYESWAEVWERQALVKARFVSGNRDAAMAWQRFVTPFVYRSGTTPDVVAAIRSNKQRIEAEAELTNEQHSNIKRGIGGIRDIEFTVQLLQLEYGGRFADLRTPNTLDLLHRLAERELMAAGEAEYAAEDYIYLRTLEHRLQLAAGHQTQSLPEPGRERDLLARRMGFSDPKVFEADLARRRSRVRRLLEMRFYGRLAQQSSSETSATTELLRLLQTVDNPDARIRLAHSLSAMGFQRPDAAIEILSTSVRGNEYGGMPPDTALRFRRLANRLLSLCTSTPDPDAALNGIEELATAVPNRAELYAAMHDGSDLMERLVSLAAAAPSVVRQLARHLEWLEGIIESPDQSEEGYGSAAEVVAERDTDSALHALSLYHQRQLAGIAAASVARQAGAARVGAQLSALTDETLAALLSLAVRQVPGVASADLCVVGLGKLGGRELGLGSDWDAVFVYNDGSADAATRQAAEEAVGWLLRAVDTLRDYGAAVSLDLRLRPWGAAGAIVWGLHALAEYYNRDAETWERQAALKARNVAGAAETGRAAVRLLNEASWGRGLSGEADSEILAMWRRVRRERYRPADEWRDLKLAPGGMLDIEWLVQRFQLLGAVANPDLQAASTRAGLLALVSAGYMHSDDCTKMVEHYDAYGRLRNSAWLRAPGENRLLPEDPGEMARLLLLSDWRDWQPDYPPDQRVTARMDQVREIMSRSWSGAGLEESE
ncbi:MAG: hypothetical protein KGJ62_14115 [Armatimonadetes bacterium]|nr:hypothetical protein [Armatimonadota bacterium]MDE2207005.1 hypothetical protein [Armatimonadota bacterium]